MMDNFVFGRFVGPFRERRGPAPDRRPKPPARRHMATVVLACVAISLIGGIATLPDRPLADLTHTH